MRPWVPGDALKINERRHPAESAARPLRVQRDARPRWLGQASAGLIEWPLCDPDPGRGLPLPSWTELRRPRATVGSHDRDTIAGRAWSTSSWETRRAPQLDEVFGRRAGSPRWACGASRLSASWLPRHRRSRRKEKTGRNSTDGRRSPSRCPVHRLQSACTVPAACKARSRCHSTATATP